MLQEAICNNELEGNNFGTLLKQLETMSQQCRVALKMSLQIVPCSTAFKYW